MIRVGFCIWGADARPGEETGGGKVDALTLYGAGSSLKGLPAFLSGELGIRVKLGDSYQFAPAIGAAFTEGKGINLLPIELKEQAKRTFTRTTIESISAAAILILVFIYIGMNIQINNLKEKISVTKMELSSLEPQLNEAGIQILANTIIKNEPHWENIFKELSNAIPPDIYLTELAISEKTIKILGVVTSQEAEQSLSGFIFALGKGIFKNVKLVTTKEAKEKSGNEFELSCRVD